MSRNLPMSNSDLRKRSSEIRYRGSTLSGCSPRVMWARLSSQRTSEVVGELLEVLGEVPDRQPRAGRVRVDGGRRDRQDARALAPALDAVLVLAATQRRDPLEVDDRGKVLPRQAIVAFHQRPHLLQDLVAPFRLAFAVEEQGLEGRQGGDHPQVSGGPGLLECLIAPGDRLITRPLPDRGDLLQRGGVAPGCHRRHHRGKPARIHRHARLHAPRKARGGLPPASSPDERTDEPGSTDAVRRWNGERPPSLTIPATRAVAPTTVRIITNRTRVMAARRLIIGQVPDRPQGGIRFDVCMVNTGRRHSISYRGSRTSERGART